MESKEEEANSIPEDFEPIKEEELKKEDQIFEIYKNEKWDKIVPNIFHAINNKNKSKEYQEYPYFSPKNQIKFLPKLDVPSEIFNQQQLKELHAILPPYHQYCSLSRVFSISVDGSNLKSFYNKCEGAYNSILAIKDDEGNVFGAYASETFSPTATFHGTGDCFLFTFFKENKIHVYNSTGLNEHYMYSDNEQICFGCTDNYFSLVLQNNFLDGYSKKTQTYQNESLNKKDKFVIVKLELWAFSEK